MQESSKNRKVQRFPVADIPADIGARVLKARKARKLSQAKLAARAGLSRAVIYRLEKASVVPRADTLIRIARALGAADIGEFVPAWPEWDLTVAGDFRETVREGRRRAGLSLSEVAEANGISSSTLSRFERGIGAARALIEMKGDEEYLKRDPMSQFADGQTLRSGAAQAKAAASGRGSD